MAKLLSYYTLCPLIDHQSFLGVCSDISSGYVTVTLGKNIIIRYRLNDQKQVNSWSSKGKLTSPVVFDVSGNQYVTVCDHSQLKVWTENDSQLEKVRKYTFTEVIHSICSNLMEEPLVIFSNGYVSSLSVALDSRKEEKRTILKDGDTIEEYHIITIKKVKCAVFITRNTKKRSSLYVVTLTAESCCVPGAAASCVLQREKARLIGQTVVNREEEANLVTLWSDGEMYMMKLDPDISEKPPGSMIHVFEGLNLKSPVAIASLSSSHFAMYGADPSDEGAAMIIFNVQFSVIQSRHHFKLFTCPPRMWIVDNNIFVPIGQNLVVVPFCLETERLANLVGSHKLTDNSVAKVKDVQQVSWSACESLENEIKNMEHSRMPDSLPQHIPKLVQKQILHLTAEGHPESVICEHVFPVLMEMKDLNALSWCLSHLSDIPEKVLIQVLHFCMQQEDSVTNASSKHNTENMQVDYLHDSGVGNGLKDDMSATDSTQRKNPLSMRTSRLVNQILCVPFSEVYLLPELRSIKFCEVLQLLHYFHYLLTEEESASSQTSPNFEHVLQWTNLLLDAHYQEYLLSQDPDSVATLVSLKDLVDNQLAHLEELKQCKSLLLQMKEGWKLPRRGTSKWYSIEVLQLY